MADTFDGYIDAVTSSRYVVGWAYDRARPTLALQVSVRIDGEEVAQGLANRYRSDLAEAGCGTGWCAFRLRVLGPVSRLRRRPVSLIELPGEAEIRRAEGVALLDENEEPVTQLEQVTASDPTLVHTIAQLQGCEGLFGSYIGRAGVEHFVRAAYVYVLGRPADPSGLGTYGEKLRDGSMTPYGLLRTLYDSDEFRSAPRLLIAPNAPGFVFDQV